MNLSAGHQRLLLVLARLSIQQALAARAAPALPDDSTLQQPAGCFVSLHQTASHRLRGCVGRLDAKAPLAQTVAQMARAVLEDPRFLTDPVTLRELDELDIELSILSPLARVESPLDFEPLSHGIYLTHGERSGCFLPQVARDTGWNREQLLDRLCTEKLGLPGATWRQAEAKLYRFSVLLIGPERFFTALDSPFD